MKRTCNMDGRYAHFLSKAAERSGPKRIICVDCLSASDGLLDGDNTIRETLVSWHAVCLRLNGQGYEPVCKRQGVNDASWWTGLADELRRDGSLWICSYQCGRAWALLGLWDALANGGVRISGADLRTVINGSPLDRPRNMGLLVAEDPPNIAQIRVGSGSTAATWVDLRNYGVELPGQLPRGRDCVLYLAKTVTDLDYAVHRLGGGGLCTTVAATAWRSWRTFAMHTAVHCHSVQSVLDMEFAASHGGRCECFRLGPIPEPCYRCDFRLHYGAIMAEEKLPVRLNTYTATPEDVAEVCLRNPHACIARVTVKTREPAYPYLMDGNLVFPVGTFETTLAGPELRDAVLNDRVTQWHAAATYDLDQCLSEYAKKVYAMRCRAERANYAEMCSFLKAMLVTLPGKLGARRRCWETQIHAVAPELWGEWVQPTKSGDLERWRSMAGVCQVERLGGYAPDAVPSMAAFITAYGRYRLLKAIRCAGWHNVYYLDTDCLVVNRAGWLRLHEYGYLEPGEFGGLECRAEAVYFEPRGIKYYVEGENVKCSGCARGVVSEAGDGKHRWYTPPPSHATKAKRQVGNEAKLVTYPAPAAYKHGVVNDDGTVSPHIIGEV